MTPSYLQRFREKFEEDGTTSKAELKLHFESFLTQERQQLIQEAVEKLEKMKMTYPPLETRTNQQEALIDGYNDGLNDAIEELSKLNQIK